MLNLPVEIIGEICVYLTNTQMHLLRRCCRKLCESVARRPIILKIEDFRYSLKLLSWTLRNGCVWNDRMCSVLFMDLPIGVLKYFPDHVYSLGPHSFKTILSKSDRKIIQHFISKDFYSISNLYYATAIMV